MVTEATAIHPTLTTKGLLPNHLKAIKGKATLNTQINMVNSTLLPIGLCTHTDLKAIEITTNLVLDREPLLLNQACHQVLSQIHKIIVDLTWVLIRLVMHREVHILDLW